MNREEQRQIVRSIAARVASGKRVRIELHAISTKSGVLKGKFQVRGTVGVPFNTTVLQLQRTLKDDRLFFLDWQNDTVLSFKVIMEAKESKRKRWVSLDSTAKDSERALETMPRNHRK